MKTTRIIVGMFFGAVLLACAIDHAVSSVPKQMNAASETLQYKCPRCGKVYTYASEPVIPRCSDDGTPLVQMR